MITIDSGGGHKMLLIYQTIKITIGVIASIFIASLIGLDYQLSAGIVTLLSLFDIKRKSIKLGVQRIYTAIFAFSIASFSFAVIGFNLFGLAAFLLFFIPICICLEARVGIVVNTVLVGHLFQNGQISVQGLMNELLILFIGITIAWVFNLHTPNMEKNIRNTQLKIEEDLKEVLRSMSHNLQNYCEINQKQVTLERFKESVTIGINQAKIYQNNYYLKDNSYFVAYFEMRMKQYERLKYMSMHIEKIIIARKEADIISLFTNHIADRIHQFNNGAGLLKELDALRLEFRKSELPKTRQEFENRAMLYQFLNDLEGFVQIKLDFSIKFKEFGFSASSV